MDVTNIFFCFIFQPIEVITIEDSEDEEEVLYEMKAPILVKLHYGIMEKFFLYLSVEERVITSQDMI